MSKKPTLKKAGAPEKDSTNIMRLTVSARIFEYLGWLSRNTMLGASENDVARYILTEALKALRIANYGESDLVERRLSGTDND